MKIRLIIAAACLSMSGCAYLHSTTTRTTDPQTGVVTERTDMSSYLLWASKGALSKFSNRSGYSGTWGPGTYVGGASGESQNPIDTNAVALVREAAAGAAEGAVKGFKSGL